MRHPSSSQDDQPGAPAGRVSALRREDMLALDFAWVNLRLEGEPPRLVRATPGQPAYLLVHFPAQHIVEEAFVKKADGGPAAGPAPVRALLAGPTRLVFKLPDRLDSIPYTLPALLDWTGLAPSLSPSALPPDATEGPALAEPGDLDTALEIPADVVLSPDASAAWAHGAQPVTRAGRTELWHTRLGLRRTGADGAIEVDDRAPVPVRAVWQRPTGEPFRAALGDVSRSEIARLSADFGLKAQPPFYVLFNPQWRLFWLRWLRDHGIPLAYTPRPITAQPLLLTSLGASARLASAWDYPTVLDDADRAFAGYPLIGLEQWQQIVALGRDQYVRTVRKGYLCPTAHRAALVTITQREFSPVQVGVEPSPQGPMGVFGAVAYLRQYRFIVVQEPLQDYAALGPAYQHAGREMPLKRLRLLTQETPKLDPLPDDNSPDVKQPFWPTVNNGQLFRFALQAEDGDGQVVNLALPLLFVPIEAAVNPQVVVARYNVAPSAQRTADLAGQAVAFAPTAPGKPGATSLKAGSLTFEAQLVAAPRDRGLDPAQPRWLPQARLATVSIPAVAQLLGRSDEVAIRLDDDYLANGVDRAANQAEVFARLQTPLSLAFPSSKGGGVVRPDMGVDGLSRALGPVAKVDALRAGAFDTSAFAQAKLLGGITLADLLAPVGLDPADFRLADLAPDQLKALLDQPGKLLKTPLLTQRPLYPPGVDPAAPSAAPSAVETRFAWKPAIADFAPPPGVFRLRTRDIGFADPAELVVRARLVAAVDGTPSQFAVDGALRRFALDFADAVRVTFRGLTFHVEGGKKLDVSAEGVAVTFAGPLKFVDTLKDLLPADGFSDPPSLAVTAEGVTAGYTLGLPSVGVGIFSLQNLALSAALSLPFVDKPAGVRFALSERHHPFLVTVALFGGGGFFALAVNAKGIEQIEAALEFGGNISLNLGVASGGVSVMAGIYFAMLGDDVKLTGYLRCGGYLSVLGIVSISVEFYLAFTYRDKGGDRGEVWGQASLTVCVTVACFSKSVALTAERRFAGAAGDPTFAELVAPDDWAAYCAAFA